MPHCGKIEFERIALVNGQSIRTMARAQIRHDVAIDLDYVEMLEALQQRQCQGTEARSDFHETVAGLRADGRHHVLDHTGIFQEILAKTLARRRHVSRTSRTNYEQNSAAAQVE